MAGTAYSNFIVSIPGPFRRQDGVGAIERPQMPSALGFLRGASTLQDTGSREPQGRLAAEVGVWSVGWHGPPKQ